MYYAAICRAAAKTRDQLVYSFCTVQKMLLNCTIQISSRKIARLLFFFFHIKLANLLVYVIVKNAKHPIQVINLLVNKSNNCMYINNIIKGTFISK